MARDVLIIRGAIAPDHIHMLVSGSPSLAPSNSISKVVAVVSCRMSLVLCVKDIGASICGPAVIFAVQ